MSWLLQIPRRLWRRCTFFFSRAVGHTYWSGVAVLGGLLEAIGVLLAWKGWEPWAAILLGVGGSVLATVLVSLAGPAGDEVYQTFLRLGVTEFYPNRKRYERPEINRRWVHRLGEAKYRCVLLGQAHGEWCLDPDFPTTLRERVRSGVKVEIFFLDPMCKAADVRAREDSRRPDKLKPRIRSSIRQIWEIREGLEAEFRDSLKLYVYDATPSLGLTWIDDFMLVTHYLAGLINRTAPLLRLQSRPIPDTLFAVHEGNVREIRENFSHEITPDNIARYITEDAHA